MKVSYVIGAFVLSKAAHAAMGDGSEHLDHESSNVVGGSSTVTEVIWTDVNTFISITSGVASDSVTRFLATTTSVVTKTETETETATGIPCTAKYGENTSGVVSPASLSNTTSSVGSTASPMSSAFTDVVVSTRTNEAVGGTSTSTESFSGVNSTVKLTSTVVVTTVLPPPTSTVNWTSISMDTQPDPVTSTETSTSPITTLPLSILTTADVIKASSVASKQVASDTAISSSSSKENEATFILSTSTSTFTVVVTGPTRNQTTTVRIGRKPSTSTTIFTSAECLPKTVFITVGAGHPSSKPVEAATSVITSSNVKPMISSAPNAITNSTTLNTGVGATGIPQYKNLTSSTTGTGGLNYTSATNPAKTIFTGGVVNMLNHNKKCLAEIAAGLAVLFGRRFV